MADKPIYRVLIVIIACLALMQAETKYSLAATGGVPTIKQVNNSIFSRFLLNDSGTLIAKNEVKPENQAKIESDTSAGNKIVKFWSDRNQYTFYMTLRLLDYDQPIKIKVFNILGHEVLDVFDGLPLYQDSESPYEINAFSLPNGIYICKVIGKNFHLNRKFIISR